MLQPIHKSPVLSRDISDGRIKAFILHIRLLGSTKSELSPVLWRPDYRPDFLHFSQVIFSLNFMEELPKLEVTHLDTGVPPPVRNSRLKLLQFHWLKWKYITMAINSVPKKRIDICMFSTMWLPCDTTGIKMKEHWIKKIHFFVLLHFFSVLLEHEGMGREELCRTIIEAFIFF